MLQKFIRQLASKVVEEFEQTLNKHLEAIESNELKNFVRSLVRIDPFRPIGKVIEDLENDAGIRCVPIETDSERALLKITESRSNCKKRIDSKILDVLVNYPFLQGKLEKDTMELKKVRYLIVIILRRLTSDLVNKCSELAKSKFEEFRIQVRHSKNKLALKNVANKDLKASYERQLEKGLKDIVSKAERELEIHRQKIKNK